MDAIFAALSSSINTFWGRRWNGFLFTLQPTVINKGTNKSETQWRDRHPSISTWMLWHEFNNKATVSGIRKSMITKSALGGTNTHPGSKYLVRGILHSDVLYWDRLLRLPIKSTAVGQRSHLFRQIYTLLFSLWARVITTAISVTILSVIERAILAKTPNAFFPLNQ